MYNSVGHGSWSNRAAFFGRDKGSASQEAIEAILHGSDRYYSEQLKREAGLRRNADRHCTKAAAAMQQF